MDYMIRTVAASGPKLVAVPDEAAQELATLYQYFLDNPSQVGFAEFKSPEDKATFVTRAKSWAALHTNEAGESEPLEYRQLRSSDLADTQLKFIIRAPMSDEDKAKAKLAREAAEAKRKAAPGAKRGRPAAPAKATEQRTPARASA